MKVTIEIADADVRGVLERFKADWAVEVLPRWAGQWVEPIREWTPKTCDAFVQYAAFGELRYE